MLGFTHRDPGPQRLVCMDSPHIPTVRCPEVRPVHTCMHVHVKIHGCENMHIVGRHHLYEKTLKLAFLSLETHVHSTKAHRCT